MTDPTELRRLAEAATPGPWTRYMGDSVGSDRVSDIAICDYATSALNLEDVPEDLPDTDRAANAAYIAAMHPQAALALLDRLARAETLVADARRFRFLLGMWWWKDDALRDLFHTNVEDDRIRAAIDAAMNEDSDESR